MMNYPVIPLWWFVGWLTAALVLLLVVWAASELLDWAKAKAGDGNTEPQPVIDNVTAISIVDVDVDWYDRAA